MARPAMRRQDLDAPATGGAHEADDLGWNDMGGSPPPVLVEREALRVEIERPIAAATTSAKNAVRSAGEPSAKPKGAKVAFILRLDAERHRRLRQASAVTGRSPQHLVMQALDAFVHTVSEADAHVAQQPPATLKR